MKTQNVVVPFLMSLGLISSSAFATAPARDCCSTTDSFPCASTSSSSNFCCSTSNSCESSCSDSCGHSRTVLIPRSSTYDLTLSDNLAFYDIYHNTRGQDCQKLNVYQTKFYQSTRNNSRLQSYFLPNGERSVTVAEDGSGDIGSLWLNLVGAGDTDFVGVFNVNPRRQIFGDHIRAHLNLDEWHCGAWLDLQTAFLFARNELRLSVCDETEARCIGGVNSIQRALTNPALGYGKFRCEKTRWKFGIDDVQLAAGKDWFFCDRAHHVGFYGVLGIPMGSHPSAEYLFDTSVGSSHANLGFGVEGDFGVWDCENMNVNLLFDAKYQYFFKGTERRLYDLCANGDWSRYLQVVRANQPLASRSLSNYTAIPTQVTPRSQVQVWVAPHFSRCDWQFEVGYNFWWRQAEKLSLDCDCFPHNLGIFDLNGVCGDQNPKTASTANISEGLDQIVSDESFTAIDFARDLDLNSGRQARSITNKVYAAAAYETCFCNWPLLLGLGGSYEFARKCDYPLESWAVWLKGGTQF